MKNNFVKKLLKRNASSGRASAQISTQETEAKYAQKADQYEDFEVLAERLRREGKLNEENFKRIKRRMIYGYILIATTLGAAIILQINHHSLGFVLFLLGLAFSWQYVVNRAEVSRSCYLYNFGEVTKGKIVETIKRDKISYTLSFSANALYDYFIVFSFLDQDNKLITTIQQDLKRIRPKKFYQIGDEVDVYYDRKNPKDVIVEPIDTIYNKNYFNLLLTPKN